MSFAAEVKEELIGVLPKARHCRIAEIAAFLKIAGMHNKETEENGFLCIHTENAAAARKVFTLIKKAFNITVEISGNRNRGLHRSTSCTIRIEDPAAAARIRKAAGHQMLLSMDCCRRSFLRGAFLAGGSINSPVKDYHFEIACPDRDTAELVQETMRSYELDAKTVLRKDAYIVYLKEGAQIVEMLGLMGAGISLMKLENARILREMKGTINRRVNCEAANLGKTVAAAQRQIEDIRYIRDHGGFGELSPALQQMAKARLEDPEASLTELGENMTPKVGKSGVNHRMRKLTEYAAALRLKSTVG